MTRTTETAPPRPLAPTRSYVAPTLVPLGSIGGLTAGPDGEKTLDGVVGGTGGFRTTAEPTS